MANNIAVTEGSGKTVKTTDVGGFQIQNVIITDTSGTAVDYTASSPIAGDVAHDAADSGNPVKVGAKATSGAPAAISAGDRSNLWTDLLGALRAFMVDSAGAEVLGVVTASPAANTVLARLKSINDSIGAGREYETVAASATAQVLGATGATGDDIDGILVIPATTSPGNVLLLDNATSITVFAGGATSVSNLVPFYIPLNLRSVSGAWKLTTGTNVSCIGIGNFT
jgi:hypothetical protein